MIGTQMRHAIPPTIKVDPRVILLPVTLWSIKMKAMRRAGISTRPIREVLRKMSPAKDPELRDRAK